LCLCVVEKQRKRFAHRVPTGYPHIEMDDSTLKKEKHIHKNKVGRQWFRCICETCLPYPFSLTKLDIGIQVK